MKTVTAKSIKISPVDMGARKNLGIRSGDTVKVWQKIQEKGKTRLQMFEGLVLAVKHGSEPGATFTVRRVASGVGVEKIFPLYSPMIDRIEITKRSKVRRSKLYHIRKKAAKEIKRQMRNTQFVNIEEEATEIEEAPAEEAEATETPETTEEVQAENKEEPKTEETENKE